MKISRKNEPEKSSYICSHAHQVILGHTTKIERDGCIYFLTAKKQNETELMTQYANIYAKTSAHMNTGKKQKDQKKKRTVDDFNQLSYATRNNEQGNHIEKGRWGRGTGMLSVGAVQKFRGVVHYFGQQVTQVLLHGIQLFFRSYVI